MPGQTMTNFTTEERRRWKEIRKDVLVYNARCHRCRTRLATTAARIDVTQSHFVEGNVVPYCRKCLGIRSVRDFGQDYPTRDTINRPNEPCSEKQAVLIRNLGGDPTNVTRGMAADMLPLLKNKKLVKHILNLQHARLTADSGYPGDAEMERFLTAILGDA